MRGWVVVVVASLAGCAGSGDGGDWFADPLETEIPESKEETYEYVSEPPPPRNLDFAATLPGQGRYSVLQRRWTGSGWGFETHMATSLALELNDGGEVTLCRGRALSVMDSGSSCIPGNSSPAELSLVRWQEGLRGTWTEDGDWIDIELTPDASVCAFVQENTDPSYVHDAVSLRCTLVEHAEFSGGLAQTLACFYPTYAGYGYGAIEGLQGQGRWIFLGQDPGLIQYLTLDRMQDWKVIESHAMTESLRNDAWRGWVPTEPYDPGVSPPF